jgi:acetyl esterase/lipase
MHSATKLNFPALKSIAILATGAFLAHPIRAEEPAAEAPPAELRARTAATELSYGKEPLQKLDYSKPTKAGSPLIVFVHGGGWKRGDKRNATGQKDQYYVGKGYAFASVNYRLVPAATVEQQAQDVADALAYLLAHAESLGFDPKRVVLMGHSAGAHLAALVGTDLKYLENAGLSAASLRGVVPLDGACYDVPRQLLIGGKLMHDTYVEAFGSEKERQLALSPITHAAAPNAPEFLIVHVQRLDGIAQSRALGAALKAAGTPTEVRGFEGLGLEGHMEINRRIGDPAYPATAVIDAWLARVLAP